MTTSITPQELRRQWIENLEVALVDVREEGPYSDSHPFFAVSVPVSEVEEKLPKLIPRLSALIVVYDNGEGYVKPAVERISSLGYTDVKELAGGLAAYSRVGEVFRDVNSASKAFGELVEAIRQTPSLPAREIQKLINEEADLVVLDARRYEEYNTMSIPRGRSCPGGELAYRIRDIAPSPNTTVIVNCAGRTRSIIGTQSLINAGIPNKVMALRNGSIGWTLEGLDVDRGKSERIPLPSSQAREMARRNAARWAEHVGVPVIGAEELATFQNEADSRTLHLLDVRDPEEYASEHPPGFVSAPGGQLVQAIDEWVGVRGARIVLYDNDGVRARMTGSWLHQMGWDVSVLEEGTTIPEMQSEQVDPRSVQFLGKGVDLEMFRTLADAVVIDLSRSLAYRKRHIKGAYFASGPELARDIKAAPGTGPVVLTSPDGKVAAANVKQAQAATSRVVFYLIGGNNAWTDAGMPVDTEYRWLSEPIDVYKRPYEGTDNARSSMQAYIDWELQLVAQLANDGVSRFRVARAAPSLS